MQQSPTHGRPTRLHGERPRGIVNVDDRMLACARQAAEGVSRAVLAREYGVSVHTIHDWIGRVREALEDARHRAALGGT